MELTEEEFNGKFNYTVDNLLVAMAEHTDINPEKFYSMACILENLALFSPVIYSVIQNSIKSKKETDRDNLCQE